MFNGRRIARVFGETIREIGILIIVFVALDAAFAPGTLDSVTLREIKGAALGLIVGGMIDA